MNVRGIWITWCVLCLAYCQATVTIGQVPSFGPTASAVQAVATPWPIRPPARIYVMPFTIEPGLAEQLQQQNQNRIIPQGPVQQMLASRPRVIDMVSGYDRSQPMGFTAAKMLTEELDRAGLPAMQWAGPGLPPADGWLLNGQIVSLTEGSVVAKNLVGFGVGNTTVGIDVMLSDPATAGGHPFFILDSSDKGRMIPGTLALGAVSGFNPAVVVGRAVATQSGIADVTQQRRLAQEVSQAIVAALQAHVRPQPQVPTHLPTASQSPLLAR
jgi:hypothetical protein